MAADIAVFGGLRDGLVACLKQAYHTHLVPPGNAPAAVAAAREAVAAVVGGGGALDAAALAALPKLKAIVVFGAGYDRVDVAALKPRGIALGNIPGATDIDVADHAIGLMLAVMRRIADSDRHVRSGEWLKRRYPLMRRVTGRRLGIIGLGGIGTQVAKRAAAFDMPIGYHNRKPKPGVDYTYFPDPLALAHWAQILVVACPGGPATRHLVNGPVLASLGADGVVVNIARGSIIDEAALEAALASGGLAGAGLDVLETEPSQPSGLVGLANVVITPHIGGSTEETWGECEDRVIENLRRVVAGEDMLHRVA
jgi:lactate dehydrogenase-like 2-hydroxyacid dehydrogenase